MNNPLNCYLNINTNRCYLCSEGAKAEKRKDKNESREGDDALIEKLKEHKEKVEKQNNLFRHQKHFLPEDKALVILDWSTIQDATAFKSKCLNFTV